jgi:hypothetical protein
MHMQSGYKSTGNSRVKRMSGTEKDFRTNPVFSNEFFEINEETIKKNKSYS